MMVSDVDDLQSVMGKRVRTNTVMKNIDEGTEGRVVNYGYESEPYTRGRSAQWITVEWYVDLNLGAFAVFKRTKDGDQTDILELV